MDCTTTTTTSTTTSTTITATTTTTTTNTTTTTTTATTTTATTATTTTLSCIYCSQKFKKKTHLRNHYNKSHSGLCPFTCEKCGLSFTHENSKKRHTIRCSSIDQGTKPKETPSVTNVLERVYTQQAVEAISLITSKTPMLNTQQNITTTNLVVTSTNEYYRSNKNTVEKSKKQNRKFETQSDFRKYTELTNINSFTHWCKEYRKLTTQTCDTRLSEAVEKNINNFIHNILLPEYPDFFNPTLKDAMIFADYVDVFVDSQLTKVQHTTVTQRLRYIKWYVCFLVGSDAEISMDICNELDETINEMQSTGTVMETNKSLLCIMDPYKMAKLANNIVTILNKIQIRHIDPFINKFFTLGPDKVSVKDLVNFGNIHLKCFVELLLRFSNVPTRIQCTTKLVLDDPTDGFVAKLVVNPNGVYRIVNMDKTGKYAQVVSIPVDVTTAGYLLFYIRYCRPNQNSNYVFQAPQGGIWTRASRDLKDFLFQYDIKCDDIAPNGRFIHSTRSIGIAVFSILCNFDISKIRNFATLMRHQLIHVEHIYSPWLKLEQSKSAAQDICKLRGFDTYEDDKFNIVNISKPQSCVQAGFRQIYDNWLNHYNTPILIRFKDMCTQTADPCLDTDIKVSQSKKRNFTEIDDDIRLPTCTSCNDNLVVLGPVGSSRSKYYGRFYLNCIQCDGKQPNVNTIFYTLGITPRYKSQSTKPRNMAAITEYINKSTNINNS